MKTVQISNPSWSDKKLQLHVHDHICHIFGLGRQQEVFCTIQYGVVHIRRLTN